MIDKLDLRIPRKASFSPTFGRLYPELQALERGPFHPSGKYEYAADLREYGFNARLHLYCRMNKEGNHKLELIDVGTMKRTEIMREVVQIFDIDPRRLGVMRIDFSVDVPNVPLQWFRETVCVQHKRFRSAVTGQPFYSEMGSGGIETLYFGKRPNVFRIYDKASEYQAQYKRWIRKLPKDMEPPTFEERFGHTYPDGPLTRVERQYGGRIPPEIETLGNVCADTFSVNPFANLKIIDHAVTPVNDGDFTFEGRCTGLYLRHVAESHGMQACKTFISRHSRGNAGWALKKYASFLPSATSAAGVNAATLYEQFRASLTRQMAG